MNAFDAAHAPRTRFDIFDQRLVEVDYRRDPVRGRSRSAEPAFWRGRHQTIDGHRRLDL